MELFKEIKSHLQKNFPAVHAERTDLYCYFYARAVQLAARHGLISFISSNKWLRSGYGARLRAYLSKNCSVRQIVDFGELPVFETAATDPLIFIAQKCDSNHNSATVFTRVVSLEPPYPDVAVIVQRDGYLINRKSLSGGVWTTADHKSLEMLDQMEKGHKSFQEYVHDKIYWDVKTGLNAAFIINRATRDRLIKENHGCETFLRPIYVGDDVRKWRISHQDMWIIYVPKQVTVPQDSPILRHLLPYKPRLQARATEQMWYQLQQAQRNYADAFGATKIVFPDIAMSSRFSLDESRRYPLNTVYVLPIADLYLLSLLNSGVVWRYCQKRLSSLGDAEKGGRLRFFRQFVEKIPIPEPCDESRRHLSELAKKCTNAHGIGCEKWEKEIDERVAALYGL